MRKVFIVKHIRIVSIAMALFLLTPIACSTVTPSGPPRNALLVNVVANPSLQAWLDTAVETFNAEKNTTQAGDTIYIQVAYLEAGQAVLDITAGKTSPDIWLPDDPVWAAILADQGNSSLQSDCLSVASSPLVIAMWRPVAESLGWPGRDLGWLDIGSLAADPSSWAYYSGGQFGPVLRLGHTHPGLSASGASTMLAVVQSAQLTNTAVSVADVQKPIVQASVSAFESAVSWFSNDTNLLGSTMRSRGITYLGAAVMYESSVVQYGMGDPEIVAIYPFEGTFVATHPACLNQSSPAPQQEAAAIFRSYLTGETAQRLALAQGLRPVNPLVPVGMPLDAAHGVDSTQPAIVFEPADMQTIYAVQQLWQSSRKKINLVMLIDTSGSMEGQKLRNVQAAAGQFVNQMGSQDYLTLIAFSNENPRLLLDHMQIDQARDVANQAIRDLVAGGNTPLYDALGYAAEELAKTNSSQVSNVLVVLTDGKDTGSKRFAFNSELIETVMANDTTVFTIAYGSDADEKMLSNLAVQANGNFYLGNEANIATIYEEMSAGFGGSVGIGR